MPLVTRAQLLEHLHEEGIPLGKSTLDKLCTRSDYRGPPIAGWLGQRPLHDLAEALAWGQMLLRSDAPPNKSNKGGRPRNADPFPMKRPRGRPRKHPAIAEAPPPEAA
jgi:hypothetical protein